VQEGHWCEFAKILGTTKKEVEYLEAFSKKMDDYYKSLEGPKKKIISYKTKKIEEVVGMLQGLATIIRQLKD